MTYGGQTNQGLPLEGVILWQVIQFPLDILDVIVRNVPPAERLHELAAVLQAELIQGRVNLGFRLARRS